MINVASVRLLGLQSGWQILTARIPTRQSQPGVLSKLLYHQVRIEMNNRRLKARMDRSRPV
jgi:hypothetical protein